MCGQGRREEWGAGPRRAPLTPLHTHSKRGQQAWPNVPNKIFSKQESPAALSSSHQHTRIHFTKFILEVKSQGPGGRGAGSLCQISQRAKKMRASAVCSVLNFWPRKGGLDHPQRRPPGSKASPPALLSSPPAVPRPPARGVACFSWPDRPSGLSTPTPRGSIKTPGHSSPDSEGGEESPPCGFPGHGSQKRIVASPPTGPRPADSLLCKPSFARQSENVWCDRTACI